MIPPKDFPKEILDFRTKRGLSLIKFGELVGENYNTIHRWEKRQVKPTKSKINKIRNILRAIERKEQIDAYRKQCLQNMRDRQREKENL